MLDDNICRRPQLRNLVRTSQLHHGGRCLAFSVDSIERMLVSATPPAGQPGHGKMWLLEYNTTSKL